MLRIGIICEIRVSANIGIKWYSRIFSFYDTFEDNNYTITKNEQLGTTTTEKPTKSSFDAIMFTKDGIEPLDDSAFVLTNTHLMAGVYIFIRTIFFYVVLV